MEERNNNDNHNNKKTCLFLSESATFPGRRESFHLFPKVTKPPVQNSACLVDAKAKCLETLNYYL